MCTHTRNPLHCILPPYITSKMADSKNKNVAELGLKNKFRSTRFRNDRKFFSSLDKDKRKFFAVVKAAKPKPKPVIKIYNCSGNTTLPGALMNVNSTESDYRNVYNGAEQTWKFYYDLFKRNSIDNKGLQLVNSIHYDKKYDNAFWNGRQMVYGDGDGKYTASFTSDIDVIAHELTHGVTEYEANLNYENQSGALNESFSDVFGIMIKQRFLNEDVKKSNWLIGENVFIGKKYAIRSMKKPGSAYKNHPVFGSDPQPATMDKYKNFPNTEDGDYGGVHYNSGIPNYAFYVCAYNMGGYAWEKAGRVWYKALTELLSPDSDFSAARDATIKSAEKLFGKNSLEVKAVKDGWKAAKV